MLGADSERPCGSPHRGDANDCAGRERQALHVAGQACAVYFQQGMRGNKRSMMRDLAGAVARIAALQSQTPKRSDTSATPSTPSGMIPEYAKPAASPRRKKAGGQEGSSRGATGAVRCWSSLKTATR